VRESSAVTEGEVRESSAVTEGGVGW